MEAETLFIVMKLAYRPQVAFMVLLFCPVSCWTKSNSLQIAEEIFQHHMIWERIVWIWECTGSFWSICTAPFAYELQNIRITWRWHNFRWKQILRIEANSWNPRNIRPAKYKHSNTTHDSHQATTKLETSTETNNSNGSWCLHLVWW